MLLSCYVRVSEWMYTCLNVKEPLAWNRRDIWSLSDSNGIRTHNHLVRKRTLNHLVKLAKQLSCVVSTYLYGAFDRMLLSCHIRGNVLAKWFSVLFRTKWLWIRNPSVSLKLPFEFSHFLPILEGSLSWFLIDFVGNNILILIFTFQGLLTANFLSLNPFDLSHLSVLPYRNSKWRFFGCGSVSGYVLESVLPY